MATDCCVYAHIAPNNKTYIGITSQSTIGRWGCHGQGYKNQPLFWRAIKKFGWDNIKHIVIIEHIEYEVALLIEQALISKYSTDNPKHGYNLTKGGEGVLGYHFTDEQLQNHKNWLGRHHTEETKRKISEKKKGCAMSDEQRKKLSDMRKGKPSPNKGKHYFSEEYKQQLSLAMKGRKLHTTPHSEETKRKISEHSKGRVVSEETKEKLRQRALDQWKRQKQITLTTQGGK